MERPSDNPHGRAEAIAQALGNAIAYVSNELVVLTQYEAYQEDKFPELWDDAAAGAFDARMNSVEEHLGGPPEAYLVATGASAPLSDSYPRAALREALDVFRLARKSVLRSHMFMTGALMLQEDPTLITLSSDPAVGALFVKGAEKAFWEHAEAAYIRLYSFWDRVGQILDFAYFNIRKFDQNGFHAVVERVAANVAPMNPQLKDSGAWKRVRAFQSSEKDDGLKWLLLRRNLIIHSLHLHPLRENDDAMLRSQFNHLDSAHREKLRPRQMPQEVKQLMVHLNRAATLFNDCLVIVRLSPSRKVDRFVR